MSEHAQSKQTETTKPEFVESQEVVGDSRAAVLGPVWDTLQQGIGNQALGRLVESQRAAAKETPTRVSPDQQREIDASRSGGLRLEGAPGVRLHYGENAQALARGLNARAFTQGSDIFFGEHHDPNSEAGRTTLAHELTHVANGAAMAGAVQREGEGAPGANKPAEVGTTDKGEERYTLTLSDGIHDNLSKEQALGILNTTYETQQRALDQYSGEWGEINKGRLSFFGAIGGALVDLAGQDFPSYEETWKEPYEASIEVRKALRGMDVKGAAEALKKEHDSYQKGNAKWSAYKAQLDSAATKAQIGIVVVAVVAVVVIATGGAAAAALAPEIGGGAAGAGGMGIAGAGGGGVGAGGGIAGGTVATGAGAGAGAGVAGGTVATGAGAGAGAGAAGGAGGTVIMGGAPTIAAGAGGAGAGAGAGAAGAGGGTVIMGGAPTIAGATGAGAGAGGGVVVGGGTAAGAGGGAVVGGGVGGSVATGATIPGAATIAGVTEGGVVAEATAQQATGVVVRAVAAEGAAGGTAVAQGMSVWTLEAVLARLSVAIGANAPFTSQEAQLLKRAFDIVNEVWKAKSGLPGGPPGP